MNWAAISTISEVIAASAVVLSLVYLAIQTRQNNKVLRTQAVWDAQNSFVAINETLSDGGVLSELIYRAMNTPDSLTVYEQYLTQRFIRGTLQRVEAQFALYTNGILDDEVWQLRRNYIKSLIKNPLMQQIWHVEKNNLMFTQAFIKEIDTAPDTKPLVFLGEQPAPNHVAEE
jgi:hypothetical protein